MKIKQSLFTALLLVALVAPSFASPVDNSKSSESAKALTEIKSMIQDINYKSDQGPVKVNVHFMINTSNEVVVLRTSNQEVDDVIKYNLNYKSLRNRDLEANKVYILPVLFEG